MPVRPVRWVGVKNAEHTVAMKKAVIFTLGCRLNHADTALISTRLKNAGFELVDNCLTSPDLIVINSCAITAEAERKSRQMVRKLRREHPYAQIAVTGCAAEISPDKFRECGADLTLSNPDKKEFPSGSPSGIKSREQKIENFSENTGSSFPFRTRAFVKIQEGCNNFCTYCIVPYVRGASRSRKFAECVADCRQIIEAGFPEIVLTGVNTCNYFDDGKDLGALIREIASIPGNFRIRLSSTEPHPSDFTIPELMADPANRLCRFLHLSMQHGSDRILQSMNRRYSTQEFIAFVQNIRKLIPDIHIGTDFIVGVPGETDRDFQEMLEVAGQVGFANIHAFAYSIRPGTPAAAMPGQIPAAVTKARMKILSSAAQKLAADFASSQIGKELPVILEQEHDGMLSGWSDNYLAVTVPAGTFPSGKIVNITANKKNLALNLKNSHSGSIL